jgi:DNA-binding MarR family transcriptional regulator
LGDLRGATEKTSSFSRSISKLEKMGWLSESYSVEDARKKLVRLTVKGRHRLRSFSQTSPKPIPEVLTGSLPKTSMRHYLTAKTALNIPSDEGTGDWHFFEMFVGSHGRKAGPFFIAGINVSDTFDILGLEGIADESEKLRELGLECNGPVYAASHYRAMADLIYYRLQDGVGLDSYKINEWFPALNDQGKLIAMLQVLATGIEQSKEKQLNNWLRDQKLCLS